jgi:hypothetical protein
MLVIGMFDVFTFHRWNTKTVKISQTKQFMFMRHTAFASHRMSIGFLTFNTSGVMVTIGVNVVIGKGLVFITTNTGMCLHAIHPIAII